MMQQHENSLENPSSDTPPNESQQETQITQSQKNISNKNSLLEQDILRSRDLQELQIVTQLIEQQQNSQNVSAQVSSERDMLLVLLPKRMFLHEKLQMWKELLKDAQMLDQIIGLQKRNSLLKNEGSTQNTDELFTVNAQIMALVELNQIQKATHLLRKTLALNKNLNKFVYLMNTLEKLYPIESQPNQNQKQLTLQKSGQINKKTVQTQDEQLSPTHGSQLTLQEQNSFYRLSVNEEQTLRQMKEWLYSEGAKYQKVKVVCQHQGYRGAIATKSIKKHQTIVFIPRSELLVLEDAKLNSICSEVLEIVSKPFIIETLEQNNHQSVSMVSFVSPKHTLMSVYLLEQRAKGKESRFHPYIELLPGDHSCFPINYSTEELQELIGSAFMYQIREKVLDLKRDYDILCSVSQKWLDRQYTFKEFCWARMMIGSRVFGVHIHGQKTEILAPFADMLNHKLPKETNWNYSDERQGFYIESLRDIALGEELFDSYGKKCNSRFLLSYGFVMDQNDRNQVCISVDFCEGKGIPLFKEKLQMLKESNQNQQNHKKIFRVTRHLEENAFFQLMGFLRFKNTEKLEALKLLRKISRIDQTKQSYKPSRTPPTTMQIEIKIWTELKKLCQEELKTYPTTYEDDEKILTKGNLTYNLRNILILRMGEKRIFLSFIEKSTNVIQILKKGYEKALVEAADGANKNDYLQYLEKALKMMPHKSNASLKKIQNESELLNGEFKAQ